MYEKGCFNVIDIIDIFSWNTFAYIFSLVLDFTCKQVHKSDIN